MTAGGISVTRSLAIDGALVPSVLTRLRRDVPGGVARWTLGDRGSAEIDVAFFPIVAESGAVDPVWSSTARLWDPDGLAMLATVVEIRSVSVDTCVLTLRPATDLAPWWEARRPALVRLAHGALDEVAEELLWHASRDGVATHSDF